MQPESHSRTLTTGCGGCGKRSGGEASQQVRVTAFRLGFAAPAAKTMPFPCGAAASTKTKKPELTEEEFQRECLERLFVAGSTLAAEDGR